MEKTNNGLKNEKASLEPQPVENKTLGYEEDSLRSIVYMSTNTNKPISYHRLYNSTFKRMKLILQYVDRFYSKNIWQGKITHKLPISDISKNLEIPESTVRSIVLKLSSCKSIIKRVDGRWITELPGPLLIVQQKPKYIDKRWWGRRTPLYVYSVEKCKMALRSDK